MTDEKLEEVLRAALNDLQVGYQTFALSPHDTVAVIEKKAEGNG